MGLLGILFKEKKELTQEQRERLKQLEKLLNPSPKRREEIEIYEKNLGEYIQTRGDQNMITIYEGMLKKAKSRVMAL